MEPRTTGESVELAPRAEFRQQRWNGRTMTLVLAQPLKADQTYILFVSRTARDRHGNEMRSGAVVPFTTAPKFSAGRISGTVDAVGFEAAGTCCGATTRSGPDARQHGADFRRNRDRGREGPFQRARPCDLRLPRAGPPIRTESSFEPDKDVLVPADTTSSRLRTTRSPRVSPCTW
jgi:hypothetical protein